jgi:hypothetical protein
MRDILASGDRRLGGGQFGVQFGMVSRLSSLGAGLLRVFGMT